MTDKENDPNFTDKAKKKFEKTLKTIKENETIEKISDFAIKNRKDTAVYILLLLGLIISLFHPFIGQTIIGVVAGLYFADEIAANLRKFNEFAERQGVFRITIFCFIAVALFLAAPGIFFGAAIAIFIMYFLYKS